MFVWLANLLLQIWGFEVEGDPGNDVSKKLFVVVPHTSNWDFPLGILLRSAKRINVQFVAKDSLFRPPFGFIFRWLGGHPVDRSKRGHFVDKVVGLYNHHARFAIAIAPEGTRKKVHQLKTGFYHIAKQAKIPMILTKFDYGTKTITFSDPFMASEDLDHDLQVIDRFFMGAQGKVPEYGYAPAGDH